MICQILIFYLTHEEEQGITYASSLFTSQITTKIVQILTGHVIIQHISMIILTNYVVNLTIPYIYNER